MRDGRSAGRRPHARAMLRPDERLRRTLRAEPVRARCTSAICAPRCSPGASRARAAPASWCGSRTSIRSARATRTPRRRSPTSRASASTGTASRRARASAASATAPRSSSCATPGSSTPAGAPAPRSASPRRPRTAPRAPTRAPAAAWVRASASAAAIRAPGALTAEARAIDFEDELAGARSALVDDFVVWRGDGVAAYNLAVVVDDADQGSARSFAATTCSTTTPRQIRLAALLGLAIPRYAHVPLVLGAGRRAPRQAPRRRHARRAPRGAAGRSPGSSAGWPRAPASPRRARRWTRRTPSPRSRPSGSCAPRACGRPLSRARSPRR